MPDNPQPATRPPTHNWAHARQVDSAPTPGFYKVRLKPFCPWVAARVWLDMPLDDEGRLADRPRRLACQVNGEWVGVEAWWERFFPISREEFVELLANPPADPWLPTRSQPK